MTAAVVVLGHWYLAAAAAVALIVILTALAWFAERDRHRRNHR